MKKFLLALVMLTCIFALAACATESYPINEQNVPLQNDRLYESGTEGEIHFSSSITIGATYSINIFIPTNDNATAAGVIVNGEYVAASLVGDSYKATVCTVYAKDFLDTSLECTPYYIMDDTVVLSTKTTTVNAADLLNIYITNEAYEAERNIAQAVLDYSAIAKAYFSSSEMDAAIVERLTGYDATILADSNRTEIATQDGATYTFYAATLEVSDTLNFVLAIKDTNGASLSALQDGGYKIAVNGIVQENVSFTPSSIGEEEVMLVLVKGVPEKFFANPRTITLQDEDSTVVSTLYYCVKDYCVRTFPLATNDAQKNIIRAIYALGTHAKAYGDRSDFTFEEVPGGYAISGYTGSETDIVIPATYEGLPVTMIGARAFAGCGSLTSIKISNGVTSIGVAAFQLCTNLKSIEIPDSVMSIGTHAFAESTGLVRVTFGENSQLSSIDDFAFACCKSLTSIEIPDSVTSIGSSAFCDCTTLVSVIFGENSQLVSIGSYAFEDCTSLASIKIPDGVMSIGSSVFWECSNLTSIIIPVGVTYVGLDAFSGCKSLSSVYYGGTEADWNGISINSGNESFENGTIYYYSETQPIKEGYWHYVDGVPTVWEVPAYSLGLEFILNSDKKSYSVAGIGTCKDTDIIIPAMYEGLPVTEIGGYAFEYCVKLISVSFEQGSQLRTIGENAFFGCTKLASIEIPNSVTSFGYAAFADCTKLKSVYITDLTQWYSISFWSYSNPLHNGADLYVNGNKVTEIVVPDGITTIASFIFNGCTSLKSVKIPNSVTTIGESAFRDCVNLVSAEIPDSVTSIGIFAFAYCTSLTDVKIPDGISVVRDYTFMGCTSLTSVIIPDSVGRIGCFTFDSCSSLKTVYYGGTAEDWEDISIYSEDGHYWIVNATRYYYSETKPTKEGNWWHYVNGVPTVWEDVIDEEPWPNKNWVDDLWNFFTVVQ